MSFVMMASFKLKLLVLSCHMGWKTESDLQTIADRPVARFITGVVVCPILGSI